MNNEIPIIGVKTTYDIKDLKIEFDIGGAENLKQSEKFYLIACLSELCENICLCMAGCENEKLYNEKELGELLTTNYIYNKLINHHDKNTNKK